ncbi:MAG: T9SS type A sorting domain-containing protein [Chitinophagales bacterium]
MKHSIFFFIYLSIASLCSAQFSLNEAMQSAGFQQNVGQIRDQFGNPNSLVKYQFSTKDFNLSLKRNSFSYEVITVENHPAMAESGQDHFDEDLSAFYNQNPVVHISRVDVTLEGANPSPRIISGNANGTTFNYYLNMSTNAPVIDVQCYNRILYKDIYPDVDLLFRAGDDNASSTLEYEWILHPGADPCDIKIIYGGAKGITANTDGTIDLLTSKGKVIEGKLFTYTFIDEKEIPSSYQLNGNVLSYNIGSYDPSLTVVIDPTLLYATFYGGEMDETVFEDEIAIDNFGKVVMTGSTYSTSGIATAGAWDVTYSKFTDIFICKFLSNGQLSWGTYYGGKGKDGTFSIITDHEDNIIIGGSSDTDSGMATPGAYKDMLTSNTSDLLIAKFSQNGYIIWGTYYGGKDRDHIRNAIITKYNNILFSGFTASLEDIAYGPYVYQSVYGGGGDVMLGEFTKNGWPVWVTYWGDEKEDRAHVMCLDTNQNYFYVAGTTESEVNFIINSPWQKIKGSQVDAFLAYWDTSGHYYWGTYIGGNRDDRARGVNVDGAGNVYVAGYTQSKDSIASPGAHQQTWGGGYSDAGIPNDDGYLMKFDHSGHWKWGTYYGGYKEEFVRGMEIDSNANLYIVGDAQSSDSIATPDGFISEKIGKSSSSDGMFMKWDSSGHQVWGSYLGGDKVDEGNDVALYLDHLLYVSIETRGGSPVTPDAYLIKNQGGADAVLYEFETGSNCYDKYEPNDNYQQGFQLKAFEPSKDNIYGWSAAISSPGDQDWYYVKTKPALPNYRFIIDHLTQNYDLVLLNKQGVQIAYSVNPGLTSDTIVMNDLAGEKYYLGVVHDSTAFDSANCYRIRIFKGPSTISRESSQNALPDMYVFPNPAYDHLSVNLLSGENWFSDIIIYDLAGREVYHSKLQLTAGYQQFNVPVSTLERGAYQLVISNDHKFWQRSFVKQ